MYYTIDFKEFSRIYDKKSFFESDSVSLMLKLNKPHGFTTDIDVSLAINLDKRSLIIRYIIILKSCLSSAPVP